MTVGDLIKRLQAFDERLEVMVSDGYELHFYGLDNALFAEIEEESILDIGIGGCQLPDGE